MRDKISVERADKLHPAVRSEVVEMIDQVEAGLPEFVAIRIVQGLRTIEEQNALYAQGRSRPGKIVTNAKGGSSYHNYGLAIDFCLLLDKDRNGTYESISWNMKDDWDNDRVHDWMEMVNVFVASGWEWGGNWKTLKDNPHLQKTFGHTWRELLNRYNRKDFIGNTTYVIV